MPDFDETFFQEVIRLEDKVQQKDYTIQEISELVSLYSVQNRCIEKYDRQNDSISTYFLDKIRSTIVLQSTFDKLFDENNVEKEPCEDMTKTQISYMNSVKKPNQNETRDKKKEQTKKFLMMVELKQNQKKVDINKLIDDFELLRQENKKVMYGDLEDQVMALKTNIEKGIQPKDQIQLNERMKTVVNSVHRLSLSRSTFFVNPLIIQQDIQKEHLRQSQQMRGDRLTQSNFFDYDTVGSPLKEKRAAWQARTTVNRGQIEEDLEEELDRVSNVRSEFKRSNILEDLANESF